MDDPGPGGVADIGELGEPFEQPVHERAARMSGPGMDDEPGRLAHHDQVVVGESDVDRDGLGPRRPVGRRLGEELDERARLEAVALDDRLSPDEHGAVVDEAGDLGPAPSG